MRNILDMRNRLLFLMLWITIISCTINSSSGQTEAIPKFEILTSKKDSVIFYNLANQFKDKKLSVNEYIVSICEYFSGTPYIASTLETEIGRASCRERV